MSRVSNYSNLSTRPRKRNMGGRVMSKYHIKKWLSANKPGIISISKEDINKYVDKYGSIIEMNVKGNFVNSNVKRNIGRLVNRYRRMQESDIVNFSLTIRRNFPDAWKTIMLVKNREGDEVFELLIGLVIATWLST